MELCCGENLFEELEVISSVRFSVREIDVLSCLVNGRSPKFIAHLLGLSFRTVEAHIRNIKIKLDCSSKEQIVSFIEKSDKHILISQHYKYLLLQFEFEKILKGIQTDVSKNSIQISAICLLKNDINEDVKCCRLLKHLTLAGFDIELVYKNEESLNFSDNLYYIVLCSSDAAERIVHNHRENLKNAVLFTNEPVASEIESETEKIKNVSLKQSGNYYYAFFDLIRLFYKNSGSEDKIKEFRKSYETKVSKVYIKNGVIYHKLPWYRNVKKLLIFSVIAVVLSSAAIYLGLEYMAMHNKQVSFNVRSLNEDIMLKRKKSTETINSSLSAQNGIKYVVLIGQGGIGKTTLARKYISDNSASVKAEINAETYNSTIDSFNGLALSLADSEKVREELSYIKAIQDTKLRDEKIISFVLTTLKKYKNWCLLFDNVEDINVIKQFIPHGINMCGSGNVLITTRNENIKNIGFFPRVSFIDMRFLTDKSKKELFCKILYEQDEKISENKEKEIEEFLKSIPSMPLDVSTAAYYIRNTRVSLEDYLKLSQERKLEDMQSNLMHESSGYSKTRYQIISSTFDEIIKIEPEFKELLLFICLIDSQNIPKKFLKECKGELLVGKFIHLMRKFSLITEDKGDTFSLHRSTQEIGLKHILSILPQNEKITYLDHIIMVISDSLTKMTFIEKENTFNHLIKIRLNIEENHVFREKNKYITKILVALFYLKQEIRRRGSIKIFEEIMRINKGYIPEYDLVELLLTAWSDRAYLHEKEILHIFKKLQKIPKTEKLIIIASSLLANSHAQNNNMNLAKHYLSEAKSILSRHKNKDWYIPIKVFVAHRHYSCWNGYFVKQGSTDSINEVEKIYFETLKEIKFDSNFLKKDSRYITYVMEIKRLLASSYNHRQRYLEALQNVREAEFLYKASDKNASWKLMIDIEKGLTLLRMNKVKNSNKILSSVVDSVDKIYAPVHVLRALTFYTETNIVLHRFKKALQFCKKSILESSSTEIRSILIKGIPFYNMSIVLYKQKKITESLKYFSEFFTRMDEFCKGFLDKEVYDKLVSDNAFEIINDEKDIQKCLDNSLKIFSAIYGKNHSFVKNFVAENCKHYPWIIEKLKILNHYRIYYFDKIAELF